MVTNWFERGGRAYARFRPDYPARLGEFLAGLAPAADLAVDVGCGSGQLTARLAPHFATALGVEPSADQLAHAEAAGNVRYVRAAAERLPVAGRSAALITAAQAAHWFDRPAFYAEARRIAVDGAVLALVSYGVLELDAELTPRFDRFYREDIGPYWPPERRWVDTGYADIDFPFAEHPAPRLVIEKDWALAEFLGYLSTWSAVRRAEQAGEQDMLRAFAAELAEAWGDPATTRRVCWPIAMRLAVL